MNNYNVGEPIFLSDAGLPSECTCLKQSFNDLCAENKIFRFDQGVYYRPFGGRLKGTSKLPSEVVMYHMYVEHRGKVNGYYTGYTFANQIGLTTQVPFALEIATNKAHENVIRTEIKEQRAVLYRPKTVVTESNWKLLQFLDLADKIENYSDVDEVDGTISILKRYVQDAGISVEKLNDYLPFYSEDVIKNLYSIFG